MKTFIIFLGRMHSGTSDVSSKRVYATIFVFLVIAMCIGDQYFKRPVDKYLFTSILTALLGFCGMNLTAQIKAMDAKKEVASDVVAVTGEADGAKDILTSNRP